MDIYISVTELKLNWKFKIQGVFSIYHQLSEISQKVCGLVLVLKTESESIKSDHYGPHHYFHGHKDWP